MTDVVYVLAKSFPDFVVLANLEPIQANKPFTYLRNTVSAKQHKTNHYFGQDIEPHGRYMSHSHPDSKIHPGWEKGQHTFKKPLHIAFGPNDYAHKDNWKQQLKQRYNKTGKQLSKTIVKDGYDGIVTHDKYGSSEIVDLSMFKGR